jgi:voltage-gated potassium channel
MGASWQIRLYGEPVNTWERRMEWPLTVAAADDRISWLVRHPHELVVLVLPMLRPLRVLRLVTLLRVLNRTAAGSLRG